MDIRSNISKINELCSQEDVFTAKQAARSGIDRFALGRAVDSGFLERVGHGLYRRSTTAGYDTVLPQVGWKITRPDLFTFERMSAPFDGVAICGRSAACLWDIGDFFCSPVQVAVPKRFNTRREDLQFMRASLEESDIAWREGLPVTRIGKTISDLMRLDEDPSLVSDVLNDAVDKYGGTLLTLGELEKYLDGLCGVTSLLKISGWNVELVITDSLGHIARRSKEGTRESTL